MSASAAGELSLNETDLRRTGAATLEPACELRLAVNWWTAWCTEERTICRLEGLQSLTLMSGLTTSKILCTNCRSCSEGSLTGSGGAGSGGCRAAGIGDEGGESCSDLTLRRGLRLHHLRLASCLLASVEVRSSSSPAASSRAASPRPSSSCDDSRRDAERGSAFTRVERGSAFTRAGADSSREDPEAIAPRPPPPRIWRSSCSCSSFTCSILSRSIFILPSRACFFNKRACSASAFCFSSSSSSS
mmetsp:Transcript_56228/g.98181  ORF Transcript_56228/g.98181 Transcript_56228/m.98181 type:complete len:246 (-) Transcript_56228:1554-2291(-)